MFILLIATVLSSLIGEMRDAIVISIAVIINVIVGFFQEWKAEKAAYALKKFEVHHCHVRRDGKEIYIEAKKLVPGDVVLIEAGAKVPADIRLTHVIDFQVEEALLTGESKPIRKNLAPIKEKVVVGDRFNIAFCGTSVLSGKAEGIVTKTGSETHLGQIAQLISKTKEEATPLQLQIKKLSWFLGAVFLAIIIIIFFLGCCNS
jgi:Ca2+-transporting ATPase